MLAEWEATVGDYIGTISTIGKYQKFWTAFVLTLTLILLYLLR